MSTAGRSPIAERATPPWAGSIAAGDGGRRSWRRPWLSGLVTALVVMATAAVSIGIVAVAVRAVLLDDLRNYLRRTAETTAALIDGPRHALITDSSQTGSPEYVALASPLIALLAVNPDIRFAYTGTIRGDTSSFILDGDTSIERAWVGERDEPTVGEREIDRVRRTVVESTPTPTAWGIGIRAYAPIRTPPGAPFAYVGITMDANRYASWLRRVYETAALGLSVALLLALLSGLRAARSESARIRAELAIAEARAREDVAATERRALEQRLERRHRTEALGTLAGGVAHDFNNLLSVILGNAELILHDAPTDPGVVESAAAIRIAATRARDVARQILIFANPRTESRQPVALNEVIDETIILLASTLPSSIAIVWEPPPQDVVAVADPSQVTQVLMNLGVNASHALPERRGTIHVSLDQVELDTATATRLGVERGPYARLTVRDDGVGMSEEVRSRIFEPFFTTKLVGEGSGLGLSVVDGVVRGHQGAVEAQSVVGHGSTFTVYLPVGQAEADEPAPDGTPAVGEPEGLRPGLGVPSAGPPGVGMRILLIDDDEPVLGTMSRVLRRAGHTVDEFTDAEAAIAAFAAGSAEYAAVITDRTMPRISGLEVAKRVAAIDPAVPVILLSGAVQNGDAGSPGIAAVVAKPADAAALLEAVSRASGIRI